MRGCLRHPMQPIGSVLKRAAAACVILSLLLACAPTVSADDDMATASMLSDGSSGTGTVNNDGDQDDYWRIDLINGDRVSISVDATWGAGTGDDQNGWNLIGNPYPCTVDWDLLSSGDKNNIEDAIWIWNGP